MKDIKSNEQSLFSIHNPQVVNSKLFSRRRLAFIHVTPTWFELTTTKFIYKHSTITQPFRPVWLNGWVFVYACSFTKWLWVRISLLSLKLQIWCLLPARSSLTLSQTIECEFTLKLVRDMIITYSYLYTFK